jgi:hypothetical protein
MLAIREFHIDKRNFEGFHGVAPVHAWLTKLNADPPTPKPLPNPA